VFEEAHVLHVLLLLKLPAVFGLGSRLSFDMCVMTEDDDLLLRLVPLVRFMPFLNVELIVSLRATHDALHNAG
jgi:hypothetical protein